jgi:uncharacterized repeat protein (TIGR01451 family)
VNAGYYSQNVNVLKQTFTLAQNHLDPVTGCFNIRFAMAPVFNDAGVHSSTEYPYYYVVVRNLSNGITLYSDFSKAYRNGYAWKQAGSFAYTDWQLVDIPVDIDSAEVGDSIEFAFYAAACSSSSAGHSGRIYLDMVGEGLTGLYVLAQGSLAVSGTNTEIRYTLAYRNDSEKPRTNAVIGFTVPQGTVFSSIESGGLPYTTPGVHEYGYPIWAMAPDRNGRSLGRGRKFFPFNYEWRGFFPAQLSLMDSTGQWGLII